jgi:hypothetical protein
MKCPPQKRVFLTRFRTTPPGSAIRSSIRPCSCLTPRWAGASVPRRRPRTQLLPAAIYVPATGRNANTSSPFVADPLLVFVAKNEGRAVENMLRTQVRDRINAGAGRTSVQQSWRGSWLAGLGIDQLVWRTRTPVAFCFCQVRRSSRACFGHWQG